MPLTTELLGFDIAYTEYEETDCYCGECGDILEDSRNVLCPSCDEKEAYGNQYGQEAK